jgi:hypothetical protein
VYLNRSFFYLSLTAVVPLLSLSHAASDDEYEEDRGPFQSPIRRQDSLRLHASPLPGMRPLSRQNSFMANSEGAGATAFGLMRQESLLGVQISRVSNLSPISSAVSERERAEEEDSSSGQSPFTPQEARHGAREEPVVVSTSGLDRRAPWELSFPIVDSWRLTELDDIGPLTEAALSLQYTFDDDVILSWMHLGARYVRESRKENLEIGDIIRLVDTLASIYKNYREEGLLATDFAYKVMIDYHRDGCLPRWENQAHYLWSAAYVLHRTKDPRVAEDAMKRISFWTTPWHDDEQKEVIEDRILSIILKRPQTYGNILDDVQERFSFPRLEPAQIIPFLEGLMIGVMGGEESTFSPIAASSPAESQEEGAPYSPTYPGGETQALFRSDSVRRAESHASQEETRKKRDRSESPRGKRSRRSASSETE